jgi:uncharacterized protein YndB with AHSA1/START domain
MERGTYLEYDGRPAVRFERSYPHSVERLWQAITLPDELVQWFPSRVDLEPRVGGTIRFSGDPHIEDTSGTVLVFDPPHRLAFSWGGDELHLSIARIDDTSSSLTLIDVLEARNAAARNAAGWSVCLAELTGLLSGGSANGPRHGSALSWRRYYDGYLAAGLPAGAEVPGADAAAGQRSGGAV